MASARERERDLEQRLAGAQHAVENTKEQLHQEAIARHTAKQRYPDGR